MCIFKSIFHIEKFYVLIIIFIAFILGIISNDLLIQYSVNAKWSSTNTLLVFSGEIWSIKPNDIITDGFSSRVEAV